jgi:cold shock CspA family protein
MEAAKRLHQAIKKEPNKFYHYWDFALALIALEAKDQALEALEMANQLFLKEHGKTYDKAIGKIEEIKSTLPSGARIIFEAHSEGVPSICFGIVTKYHQNRGFGFIKDRNNGETVFFHISRVKDSSVPQVGNRAKFIREVGEKGPQASRVWLSDLS